MTGPFLCPHCDGALEVHYPGGPWFGIVPFVVAGPVGYIAGLRGIILVIVFLPIAFTLIAAASFVSGLLGLARPRPYRGSAGKIKAHYVTLDLAPKPRQGGSEESEDSGQHKP